MNYTYIIKVNDGRKSAIFNLVKLKFLRVHRSMKPHILCYGNDLAIWHILPYIRNNRINKI